MGKLIHPTESQAVVNHRTAQPKAQEKLPVHRRPKGPYDVGTVHHHLNLKGPAIQPARAVFVPGQKGLLPVQKEQ